jgi:hypothetical protein
MFGADAVKLYSPKLLSVPLLTFIIIGSPNPSDTFSGLNLFNTLSKFSCWSPFCSNELLLAID